MYTHIKIAFAVSYTWSPNGSICSPTCCEITTPPVCNNAPNPNLIQTWQNILRWENWEKVLHLIIKGGGTNDFVEKERGLTKPLFEPLELPAVAAECESSDGDDELDPNELVAM